MRTKLALAGAFALFLGASGQAQTPEPFKDFTFKRVSPPKPGTKKRIDVQIRPEDQLPRPGRSKKSGETASATRGTGGGTGRYAWFWETISPASADSGPGRLEPALLRLAAAPADSRVSSPRLDDLLAIARAHAPAILGETVGTRVSPALVLAVIAIESAGRADAVSRAGAQGLMQLMPQTAANFGVTDPLDPAQSIKGGIAFLDVLMKRFNGDPILVLAAYNAGETRVAEHAGVPDISETRDYVPKVLAAFETARKLCMTPPVLISDGCVFRLP